MSPVFSRLVWAMKNADCIWGVEGQMIPGLNYTLPLARLLNNCRVWDHVSGFKTYQ